MMIDPSRRFSTTGLGSSGALDFMMEPALILDGSDVVVDANAAAQRLLAPDPAAHDIFHYLLSPPGELSIFLRRARAAPAPVMGRAILRGRTGAIAVGLHGARVPGGTGRVGVRIVPSVGTLGAPLRSRLRDAIAGGLRRERSALAAAVDRDGALVHELQHRVKNTIQVMMSLLALSARGTATSEVAQVVQSARLRLHALASVQDAVYRTPQHGRISAGAIVQDLVAAIETTLGAVGRIRTHIEPVDLPEAEAQAMALAANELVTNAVRFGLVRPEDVIRVTLVEDAGGCRLEVRDDGPGLPADADRSGLSIVRRLAGQIGGVLDVSCRHGTRWRLDIARPPT